MSESGRDPNAASLIGFWDFAEGRENDDTGLADGIAQNGHLFGDAEADDGQLELDGHKDYFSTKGPDAPFDLTEGTIAVRFTQEDQSGRSSDILINRGEYNDRMQDGYFALGVTGDGRVTLTHFSQDGELRLKTQRHLFSEDDEVVVTYGWSADQGGTLRVENLTRHTETSFDFDTTGLTLVTRDDDGENFTFGARETRENSYGKFFEGEIDYVAVYDRDIINNPVVPDGIVSGTDADDLINLDYLGDPEGDRIDAGDAVIAGEGPDDDIVYAGAGDDIVFALDGDDEIYAGAGSDIVEGGKGNDLLSGGEDGGADTLLGGDDRDTFRDLSVGDFIDGGDGGDDFDTLDLTGSAAGGTSTLTFTSDDREDGVVTFFNADGVSTGQLVFENIENIVGGPTPICFTPGTLIATADGQRPVEDLRPGDRVITRDNGIQEISWKGARGLTGTELARHAHLRPIKISQGALGGGLPERDMLLSPNHRLLVSSDKTVLYFEESEVLVAAKHLTGLPGIQTAHVPWTTYIHFMFTQHEVVLSDGVWTESFQPGDYSLAGIGNAQRTELEHLFPQLKTAEGVASYQAARRSLKQHEARLLNK